MFGGVLNSFVAVFIMDFRQFSGQIVSEKIIFEKSTFEVRNVSRLASILVEVRLSL